MTSFAPALPQIAPPDPSKHVDYQLGMVLGVDDFKQEFTYSSGRDKRIVRDLIGYGVVSGLRVTVDVVAGKGPRVSVAPGECVTPSGQFVCIAPAQCAYLNDWLQANRAAIQSGSGGPPATVKLAVLASYQECETDSVPIPGEPCRTDAELRQPSRVKDSFDLALATSSPPEIEDAAIRDFVAWLRRIPVVDTPAGDVEQFIEQLRTLMDLEGSPPASPPGLLEFLYASPPPAVRIPRAAAAQYLAALFAFWVSDLRPRLRSPVPGGECDCTGAPGPLDAAADTLQLAVLTVPLAVDAPTGNLVVADTPAVTVEDDETVRPTLLHLKMLQQLLLTAAEAAERARPEAAGRFKVDGVTVAATGGLSARKLAATLYVLTFPAFDPLADYVVTGQPVAAAADKAPSTFEVIPDSDPGLSPPAVGIVVRVRTSAGADVPGGFMVRVQEVGP